MTIFLPPFKKNQFTKGFLGVFIFIIPIMNNAQTDQNSKRWGIQPDGSISWHIEKAIPHEDHIEMSGEKISSIIKYGVNKEGTFLIDRTFVWPMLRHFPHKTRNHLKRYSDVEFSSLLYVDGQPLSDEKVEEITLNGIIKVRSDFKRDFHLTRILFPSTKLPVYMEAYTFTNNSDKEVFLEVPSYSKINHTDPKTGVYGKYEVNIHSSGGGSYTLSPGDHVDFSLVFQATKENENFKLNIDSELRKRMALVKDLKNNLVLETPDPILNTAFDFAKIRGSESIYRTKGGLMHGPGGGAYYAAIWANDQAEYIGPFFPYLGYKTGNKASLNAYLQFARFMNPEYKPIPSSIIAEGESTWHGAGDRGDGAMIAYGAARFALARGDKAVAEKLWPLIEWTLEYCRRNLNKDGVVKSDSDELENRFPSGEANLCTSSLYYDALNSAVFLGKDLDISSSKIKEYNREANQLKKAIEDYFGAEVEGYQTYQYYEGNDVLRAWIAIPLTMGIFKRSKGTIDALFSPRLWTKDGLATEAGQKTFWDRATLYALRGVFAAGEKQKALKYLNYYSQRRLLGEHVPYPVEAYPEGDQRHLSAESGLYCRIYTEGLFGIRPTGLSSFSITPRLPEEWQEMAMRKIHAFGGDFDIEVSRKNHKIRIIVINHDKKVADKTINEGRSLAIKL